MMDNIKPIVDQAQEQRVHRDTLILQKVNAVHREAFKTRFPGQIEHCMRLTAERLHKMLTNTPAEISDPATWTATAQEIRDMATALHLLSDISKRYPTGE